MYKRAEFQKIKNILEERRRFIQVVIGPRQVGKSTVVKQVLGDIATPYQYFSADNVPASNTGWVSNCWAAVRSLMNARGHATMILVIDEIQKIRNWSEVVKKEWDDDTFHDRDIKVLLLGSSRVLLERGLSESLGGRFEEIRMTHWSYPEMHECFGWSLNEYMYYGGYPGAAELIHDPDRWEQYVQSAIIDATINKDILMDTLSASQPCSSKRLNWGQHTLANCFPLPRCSARFKMQATRLLYPDMSICLTKAAYYAACRNIA